MRRAILGTAGHIDHGKTALVQALTGVDTDRLPEEKARGITIDLGFAQLANEAGLRLGVVDVPGHEDFIRTMVAGASGMDVVLLTVAADEGMMPQTREHLDIVTLLAVPHMVVALTKVDLVEPEWLALVEDEVREALSSTPFADAAIVPTSSRTGEGLEALRGAIMAAAAQARGRVEDDVARLPVDRSFTVQGMGTVATGTLWSGTLSVGDRIRLLPGGTEARIRSIQVHGTDADTARAGERTAVALSGVDRGGVGRGEVLVAGAPWDPTWMITARIRVLPTAPRPLEQGVRVRVLTGTIEVLARCAVLEEGGMVQPGDEGWVQFRLEEPAVARTGDRLVIRSYAPLLTVGGGVVTEPTPPKRRRLDDGQRAALAAMASSRAEDRLDAVLRLAGWSGVRTEGLAQRTGLTPADVGRCLDSPGLSSPSSPGSPLVVRGVAFASAVVEEAGALVLAAMRRGHLEDPLRPSVPLERLRASLPSWASPVLADGVLAHLGREGALELAEGGARAPGFVPAATADQEAACAALEGLYREAGLAAPFLDDLPDALRERKDLGQLLRYLEGNDTLRTIDEGLLVCVRALDRAAADVAQSLAGRVDLGPSDFREVLPVSRKHLMPLLAYLDGRGITVRRGGVRDVPPHA